MTSAGFQLNGALVEAAARLVDDYAATREPSHADLEATFVRAGVGAGDPHRDPAVRVGKQKRVRLVLNWAIDNDEPAGARAVAGLIDMVRACGGFRKDSPNYCGDDPINNLVSAFGPEPMELTTDGVLRPRSLAGLAGRDLSDALRSYALRAQRGYEDSVLVAGTDKDLIEAAAAHVIIERWGSEPSAQNFPTLLGQAFAAVGLNPTEEAGLGGIEGARAALSAALYNVGCAVNRFRNKAGSGHGRPFVPELSAAEVRALTEAAGLVAGRLIDALTET